MVWHLLLMRIGKIMNILVTHNFLQLRKIIKNTADQQGVFGSAASVGGPLVFVLLQPGARGHVPLRRGSNRGLPPEAAGAIRAAFILIETCEKLLGK